MEQSAWHGKLDRDPAFFTLQTRAGGNLMADKDVGHRLEDLPPYGPLLGLDLGTKTIGIAISDALRIVATPLETIQRVKFTKDVEKLLAIANRRGVVGLVMGLPVNMDGSEGPRAQSTRAFVRNLAQHTALPLAFWDERWSTAAVTRTLIEADASRARRAEVVDKLAAAYILQGALDRLSMMNSSRDEDEEDPLN